MDGGVARWRGGGADEWAMLGWWHQPHTSEGAMEWSQWRLLGMNRLVRMAKAWGRRTPGETHPLLVQAFPSVMKDERG